MAEICIVCNEEITEDEGDYRYEGAVMHFYLCRPEYFENPENYGGKARKDLSSSELLKFEQYKAGKKTRTELKEKSKGMVLTDIDLPFGRVFWVTVQFFGASLLIAIPIWIIFFLIVSN